MLIVEPKIEEFKCRRCKMTNRVALPTVFEPAGVSELSQENKKLKTESSVAVTMIANLRDTNNSLRQENEKLDTENRYLFQAREQTLRTLKAAIGLKNKYFEENQQLKAQLQQSQPERKPSRCPMCIEGILTGCAFYICALCEGTGIVWEK